MNGMDIRALVLINAKDFPAWDQVELAGPPLALLDVAGKSPLLRTFEQLEQSGISQITAVMETSEFYQAGRMVLPRGVDGYTAAPERFWRTCESVFHGLVQGGADLVLIIRLGAYAEIEFERFVQFHLRWSRRVSQVVHESNAPEVFCINASRRNDAASLFRSRLSRCRSACTDFPYAGYVNPLSDARDLRQLAVDVLTLKTRTRPVGNQLRPGIWIAPGAVVETGSRILAPSFIGSSARIRAGALVTRCTTIEHHAHVDCGTVVENSTVLPYSYIGAGLDLAHSVAGMGQIANLRRSTTVEVADEKLIGHVASGTGRRLLSAATEVLSSVRRGLFGAGEQQPELGPPAGLDEAARFPDPAEETNIASEFPSRLVVARRYGNR